MALLLPTTPGCRRFRRGPASFVFAFLALSIMAVARADDAPEPSQNQPAATPSAQKSGATGEHGGATPNSPAPEQHRLPPDSTTKQTLVLPGRTLAFTATAGSTSPVRLERRWWQPVRARSGSRAS